MFLRKYSGHNLLCVNKFESIFGDDIQFVTKEEYQKGCNCSTCRGKCIELSIWAGMVERKMIYNYNMTEHIEFIYQSAEETSHQVL